MLKTLPILITAFIIGFNPVHAKEEISETVIKQSMSQGVLGVETLLKEVSIHKLFAQNKTFLHYAVEAGDYEIVSFLVAKDVLLSQKGGEFYATALQEAIYYGYPRIAHFLIEQGSPLNIQDNNGDTALHLAARNGDLDIIITLLKYGANKGIVNHSGEKAYDLVPTLTWESEEEMKILLSTKAKKNSFQYPSLEFDTLLEAPTIQKKESQISNHINNSSNVKNSNFGINIELNNKHEF